MSIRDKARSLAAAVALSALGIAVIYALVGRGTAGALVGGTSESEHGSADHSGQEIAITPLPAGTTEPPISDGLGSASTDGDAGFRLEVTNEAQYFLNIDFDGAVPDRAELIAVEVSASDGGDRESHVIDSLDGTTIDVSPIRIRPAICIC